MTKFVNRDNGPFFNLYDVVGIVFYSSFFLMFFGFLGFGNPIGAALFKLGLFCLAMSFFGMHLMGDKKKN